MCILRAINLYLNTVFTWLKVGKQDRKGKSGPGKPKAN